MSDTTITILSENPQNEKFEALKNLFPEAFSEWKLNTTILAKTLGEESISNEKESYGMTWAGKSDARKQILAPTTKTLIPDESASVYYADTENILIEWDNLEVLKLLQKGYSKQVKMIYIDPPYNTGKDFVYRDNFTSDKAEYEESTGQRDSEWNRLVQNTETNGRYHSDWLSMMYPRLHLARNLLREDGVIFVSIDDHEVHNLRKLMDEIFGEENYRNTFISRRYDKNLNRQFIESWLKSFNTGCEYILAYSKSEDLKFSPVYQKTTEKRANFWYWKGLWNDADRPTMRYNLLWVNPQKWQWKWSKERADVAVKNYDEYIKVFSDKISLEEYWEKTGKTKQFIRRNPNWKWKNEWVENWIAPADGKLRTTNWTDLLISQDNWIIEWLFDSPKNVEIIKLLLQASNSDGDIILDFFAWSWTTWHAVMALNGEEKAEAVKNRANPDEVGNRRYICVQLPEVTDDKSEAYKAGYKEISEITAERLRRAGRKIKEENPDISLDTWFRLYRIDESCFQVANVDYKSDKVQQTLESLEKAIESGVSPLRDWVKDDDVMVEVLLKEWFPLTNIWTEIKIGENTFFHTEYLGKQLYMSFQPIIAVSTIQTLGKECSEAIFVVYDTALDDSRKVMLSARVKLRTI